MNASITRIATIVVAALVIFAGHVPSASAQEQSLLEEFRRTHLQSEAVRMAERLGHRAPYRGARPLYTPRMDSLRLLVGLPSVKPPEPPSAPEVFQVNEVKSFSRLERPVFERTFEETRWTFFGVEGITGTDTLHTREIRARMQDAFGYPTKVLADVADGGVTADNNIQFEYWLVVNDSIPLKVTDPFGPFDRGIVLAGDVNQRQVLREVREELVRWLFEEYRRQPYVDYFFDAPGDQWYRAGFDGSNFFETRIRRPRLQPGMRPTL